MVVDAVFSEPVYGKNSLLTGNKNFGSGKETRRTGKPGDRKGKFVSDKIYDDAENIFISLKGCSSPVSIHLRNMQRSTEMSLLPLGWLAPDISTAILEGRQPPHLTAKTLRALPDLPLDWAEQQRILGFAQS